MSERCGWVGDSDLYIDYHDTEWGVPERDPEALFEQLILEGFQAGLSWITILRKREGFRRAFAGFDPNILATWGPSHVETLLQDAGIVRHRGKIEATIANAQAWQKVQMAEGFSQMIWAYVDGKPIQNQPKSLSQIPGSTPLSSQISKDLKKMGFKFCGPTTVYAFMQAAGLVNDHTKDCPRCAVCAALS